MRVIDDHGAPSDRLGHGPPGGRLVTMAADADYDARTIATGRAINNRCMVMVAPGISPHPARTSVRESHPGIAKDWASIAIVAADIAPGLHRAAAGSVAADVSDGSVSAVTSFGLGSREKSDHCHGGNREEFVNHVVHTIIYVYCIKVPLEPTVGLEPTTCSLQVSRSGQLS